jgi:hypothetical protein
MKKRVYFNLHKRLFSVQEKVNGQWKVIGHTDDITLYNVTFKVSEAGRQRVLKERRKNVHGYVEGYPSDYEGALTTQIRYNPYKYDSFVDELDGKVYSSRFAKLQLVNGRPQISATL